VSYLGLYRMVRRRGGFVCDLTLGAGYVIEEVLLRFGTLRGYFVDVDDVSEFSTLKTHPFGRSAFMELQLAASTPLPMLVRHLTFSPFLVK
jgi:hypothetical protein